MKSISCILLILLSIKSFSQINKEQIETVIEKLGKQISVIQDKRNMKDLTLNRDGKIDSSKTRYASLVTDYTFNRRFNKEFANILTGENSFSSLSKYATLNVDEDNSKVSFSPFTFKTKETIDNPVNWFGSLGFNAEIDGNNIFTLFNKSGYNKNFEVVANVNWIFKRSAKFIITDEESKSITYKEKAILEEIKEDYCNLLEKTRNSQKAMIDNQSKFSSMEKLEKSILDKYADYEEKLAEDYWSVSSKHWLNLSVTPYGYATNEAIDLSINQIISKDYSGPSGKFSYNYLRTNVKKETSSYINVLGDIKNKNSFTGLTPSTWNQITRLSDTTFLIADTKNVFNYDSTYTSRYLPSLTLQVIQTFHVKLLGSKFLIGIDLNNKIDMLVPTVNGGENLVKNIFSGGLIIPLTNSEGERKINIEIFYKTTNFINASIDNTDMFGVKFSVPILEN